MKREDCKEGVRVYWKGDDCSDPDEGVIVSKYGSIFSEHHLDWVWVKWDSDGKELHIEFTVLDALQETKEELTEEQAVMFLLSKGYTVSKSKGK